MTRTLDTRLQDAKAIVDRIGAELGKRAAAMPTPVVEQFRRSLDVASNIEYWRELIAARSAALQFLDGLEARVDGDDLVPVFAADDGAAPLKLKFSHVRLLGVEAYLSLTWSLADRITAMVGRVLCTLQGGALYEQSPVKLVSHFIQEDRTKNSSQVNQINESRKENEAKTRNKSTAAVVSDSIRLTFGFPIGISYAIRNHFVHDGAQQQEVEFFESRASSSGFKISTKGWTHIENKAFGYGVLREHIRAGAAWPKTPHNDLREVLSACQREMDDALGILLGSACHALAFHVGLMLGADGL